MPYADDGVRRERQRARYAADPEKYRARKRKGGSAKPVRRWGSPLSRREAQVVRHGLPRRGYDILLEHQRGVCAICGTSEPGGKGRFHVDHDHACCPGVYSCGRCVRGLLCFGCNSSRHAVEWSVSQMLAVVRYRNNPPWQVLLRANPDLLVEQPSLWDVG